MPVGRVSTAGGLSGLRGLACRPVAWGHRNSATDRTPRAARPNQARKPRATTDTQTDGRQPKRGGPSELDGTTSDDPQGGPRRCSCKLALSLTPPARVVCVLPAHNAAYHGLAGIRAGVNMAEFHKKRSPDEFFVSVSTHRGRARDARFVAETDPHSPVPTGMIRTAPGLGRRCPTLI